MLSCLWVAVDENGKAYVYRELNMPDLPASLAAETILQNTMPDEVIACTFAPPDLWSRSKDSGKSVYESFVVNGVPLVKAENNRVHGWLQVKEYLMRDSKGTPSLYVFKQCKELVRCIMSIQADFNNPNDCAKEPHDLTHVTDAIRYFCVSRTLPGEKEKEAVIRNEWEEEEYSVTGGEITNNYIMR